MIQKMFGVRDAKALAFLQPFFSAQAGSAIRAFDDECNKETSPFYKWPSDYNLYELGDFDDNSGEFVPCSPIKLLGCAADFKRNGRVISPEMEVVSNGSKKA